MTFIPESVNLREFLENLEKGLISRALKSSEGVQAEAARRLHLSRSDLAYKLTKYEIKTDRE
jgi:transcriptional regulator with GAF, ATPase, and Fis domain